MQSKYSSSQYAFDLATESSLARFLNLSDNFLHDAILHWWIFKGRHLRKEQLRVLRKSTGYCLRVDHTYKITTPIGVLLDKEWVFVVIMIIITTRKKSGAACLLPKTKMELSWQQRLCLMMRDISLSINLRRYGIPLAGLSPPSVSTLMMPGKTQTRFWRVGGTIMVVKKIQVLLSFR